jgi:hypothetical protein
MHAHLTGDGKTWGLLSCGKQKDADEFEPIRRELHRVSLDGGASSLAFADEYRTGARDQTRRRVGAAEVRRVLEGAGAPMAPVDVAAALEWDREAAKKALRRGAVDGWAYQPEEGKYAIVPGYRPNIPSLSPVVPNMSPGWAA